MLRKRNYDPIRISSSLERANAEARSEHVELNDARYIIFSDHHKGERDRRDDFKSCIRTYHAALGYYLEMGYTLVVLGDAEELWECFPQDVIECYSETFSLEAEFHRARRFHKIFGNHDDLWQKVPESRRLLKPYFGKIEVAESLRLNVNHNGSYMGTIYCVHGHQGSGTSDKYARASEFFVRHFWRYFKNVARLRTRSPSTSYELRRLHDMAMHTWSSAQDRMMMITGHTHRPVMMSQSHQAYVEQQLARARVHASGSGNGSEAEEIGLLRAELEWIRAQDQALTPNGVGPIDGTKPSYFNTGCCSFRDGDITGIEITGDQIRLVRWPHNDGELKPKELSRASLIDVLAKCANV